MYALVVIGYALWLCWRLARRSSKLGGASIRISKSRQARIPQCVEHIRHSVSRYLQFVLQDKQRERGGNFMNQELDGLGFQISAHALCGLFL